MKCSYCHFAIDPGEPATERRVRYVEGLEREIQAAPSGPADTVYFGGGTPSLLAPAETGRLFSALRSRFVMAPGVEVTLEANPGDLDSASLGRLKELGVTRLSIGAQSFDDEVLREMGRLHDAAATRDLVAAARLVGLDSISVDMILGWPGETPDRWRDGVDRLLRLEPDHVSLYILELEGKNVLAHQAKTGALSLPPDDLVADLYLETVERLAAAGIARYEISNFARPGAESRHNLKYWRDEPVLGFGMSSHSYVDGRRYWNVASYGAYCKAMESGDASAVLTGERSLTAEVRMAEALFTGLRLSEGVDVTSFGARYGVDPLAHFGGRLEDAFVAGLLVSEAGRLRLTDRGMLLSNEVFQLLV